MKKLFTLLFLLCLFSSFSADKPKILIIGDSISIGYFTSVKSALADKALVVHNPGNAEHTGTGLAKINNWLGKEKWDIIQFNWGLWDMCYRHPDAKNQGNRDKVRGALTHTPEEYQRNLDSLVQVLKGTGARLLFVTTTYVPREEAGRYTKDVQQYNKVAKKVMKKYGIQVIDMYKPSVKIHQKLGKGSDDVHYSKEGYQELGKQITPVLEKELRAL